MIIDYITQITHTAINDANRIYRIYVINIPETFVVRPSEIQDGAQ